MRAGNSRTERRTYGSDYRGVTENFSQVVLFHGVVGVSQAVAACGLGGLGGLGGPAVSRAPTLVTAALPRRQLLVR